MKTFEINCDGYSVVTDQYGDNADRVVLMLVGYTSTRNKQMYHTFLPKMAEQLDTTVIIFDYSGHGDSPFEIGETRPAQHFLEVVHVYDWIKENYPNAKIDVVGSSYGGYMAAVLTEYRKVEKLVLRAPAIYPEEDFYTLHKDRDRHNLEYRKDAEALAKNHTLQTARLFKGKSLVVVHEHDEKIPKVTTDAYTEAFNSDTYLAEGFTHSLDDVASDKHDEYWQYVVNWLKI